jgi:site-specific recombinase XerD
MLDGLTMSETPPDPANLPATSGGSVTIAAAGTLVVPGLIANAGDRAAKRFLEYFAVTIRNRNTRMAYLHAARRFFAWCERERIGQLVDIEPLHVATYIEVLLSQNFEKPTVKQHLAAIRKLFDWLVTGQIIAMNPAHAVRGPTHVVKSGKTTVLDADEARLLLNSIPLTRIVKAPDGTPSEVPCLIGLRDRALVGVMTFTFARVSAAVGMRVEDYYPKGKRWWVRLHEKGGKRHDLPAHHNLDAYVEAAGIREMEKSPLFRAARGRSRRLGENAMHRTDAWAMIQRRAAVNGLRVKIGCHTFRATGITAYLTGGGTLEKAQTMAAHESPRTTKLYDRTSDEITLDEVERIAI